MNKLAVIAIAVIVVGAISAFAISPYFTESSIDEPLPDGAIIPSEMMNKDSMDDTMGDTMMDDTMMDDTMDDTISDTMDDTMDDTMSGEIPVSYTGTFVGVNDGIHNAEGEVFTISLKDDTTKLRLENFKATNGPDLYVYLSTDDRATDIVSLGKLKANMGNQNYDIPDGTDLDKYNKVLIWCKPFGVLFGSAEISTQ